MDLPQLVEQLSLEDDAARYQAFLTLQTRSQQASDVYPYWDIFQAKLKSDNSYQRSIGLMLLAENARWDTERRMERTIDDCLALLHDEKPITIRQCVQSLGKIAAVCPALGGKIAAHLTAYDLIAVKETMRKSVLLDILGVLLLLKKEHETEEIEQFILTALSGELLDPKSKKQIKAQLYH